MCSTWRLMTVRWQERHRRADGVLEHWKDRTKGFQWLMRWGKRDTVAGSHLSSSHSWADMDAAHSHKQEKMQSRLGCAQCMYQLTFDSQLQEPVVSHLSRTEANTLIYKLPILMCPREERTRTGDLRCRRGFKAGSTNRGVIHPWVAVKTTGVEKPTQKGDEVREKGEW